MKTYNSVFYIYILVGLFITTDIVFALFPVLNNVPGSANLDEANTAETLLLTIDVTDADSATIFCELGTTNTPGSGATKFRVRPITTIASFGIYTVAGETFDMSQDNYVLDIECRADGDLVEGDFTVNLDQNQTPLISNLPVSATLSTTSAIGTTIFTVASTDNENDVITYSIVCNPVSCPFTIFDSGVLLLDSDMSSSTVVGYDVTVTVTDDRGNVGIAQTLTLEITDINNSPTISNLGNTISVPENTAYGSTLETALCTDVDTGTTLTYSMTCTPTSGLTYFEINISSGVITASTTSLINYETIGILAYACEVTCSDGASSVTGNLDFTVTDAIEAPSFLSSAFAVTTNEALATTALQSTGYDIIDQDAGDTTTFSIDCGSTTLTGYFIIDSLTGITSFATDYDVDGSQPTSVSCTVTVTDSDGLTDTASLDITINNINDNTPTFVPDVYTFFIAEAVSVGTSVGYLTASDGDIGEYGTLTYSIDTSSLAADYFDIDNTNLVYVKSSISGITGGTVFVFNASVTDGEFTDIASVTVILTSTSTTSTTTTTDRYRTFFEDTRNAAWISACFICLLVIFAVCSFLTYRHIAEDNCKILRRMCERRRPSTPEEFYFEPTIEYIPQPPPPPPVIEKPAPERAPMPQKFDFWTASNEQSV